MIILMINIKTMLLLAIVCIVAVSCAKMFSKGNAAKALTAFSNVNVDEFQSLIADLNVQLLDVRTPEEFDEGHIAGATLIDVNEASFLQKALETLDKQRPVAVYCRSGRRSARAAGLLTEQGFTVTNLNGGVIAWQDAGKTLIR